MKAWMIYVFVAVFAIAISSGCSKDDSKVESAAEDVKNAAESAAESAEEAVEEAVEGAQEAIEDTMGDLASFKDDMSGKVGELEGKLEWMKQMSGSLNNEELSGMVTDLGAKLTDCKSKVMGMENLSADELAAQKTAISSEITKLTGMFSDTESKIDALRKKLP